LTGFSINFTRYKLDLTILSYRKKEISEYIPFFKKYPNLKRIYFVINKNFEDIDKIRYKKCRILKKIVNSF